MPTIGYDTEYTDSAEWTAGSSTDTQFAIKITAPENGRILTLGGYVRGVNGYGDTSVRFCMWGTGNALKVKSELKTITEAAVSTTASVRYEGDATTEFIMTEGTEYYLGVSRAPTGAIQFGRLDNGADHWEDNAGSIAASFNATLHNNAGRLAFFATYEPAVPEVYVRRSGAWVQADQIYVRRSGAWVEQNGIYVRRSGAWSEVP